MSPTRAWPTTLMTPTPAEWPPRPLPYPPADRKDGFALRPWDVDDASALAAAWADRSIARWLDPPAVDVDSARDWIAGVEYRRHNAQALDLVIDVDGDVAGEVGFSSFDARRHAVLVGYWVAAQHRGRGLAGRAVARACTWAVQTVPVRAVLAECAAGNLASHRTAVNAGFDLLHQDETSCVFVLRDG